MVKLNSLTIALPTMLDDPNQALYAARGLVQYYAQLRMLQPAEQTIINVFKPQWPEMRMLDMGVGGGRTTQHFSNLVAEYIGIDYSAGMVAACQQRFAASPASIQFAVCDARDMSRFADNSFDFILFSFNGIDFVSHTDRFRVFQEVRRVGKPGSYFFFSSHNLQGMERAFTWKTQLGLNPLTTYVNLVMWAVLRCCNYSITPTQLQTANYAILRDESHNFRLKTYYVRPQEQIHQLEADFSHIQVYSWSSGLSLTTEAELQANTDMWLYYLCQVR